MTRERALTLAKVAVTVAGLIYVIWQVPLAEIGAAFSTLRWPWLLLAFLLVMAGLLLRAFRWHLLLEGLKVPVRFSRLLEIYFVGSFFNAFLPTGFGGDAVRVMEAARDVPPDVAAGTVIVDRLTGLLALFAMALLALPLRPPEFPGGLLRIVAAVSTLGLLAGGALLDGRLLRRLGRRLPVMLSPVGNGPVARLLQAVHGCGPRAVRSALGVSVLFNLLLVGWWAAAGQALGLNVPYSYYLLVVPILSVVLLAPSVSGLGVGESLAPALFAGAQVAKGAAVALSLVVFLVMRLAGLPGAPIYIVSLLRRRSAVRPLQDRRYPGH